MSHGGPHAGSDQKKPREPSTRAWRKRPSASLGFPLSSMPIKTLNDLKKGSGITISGSVSNDDMSTVEDSRPLSPGQQYFKFTNQS